MARIEEVPLDLEGLSELDGGKIDKVFRRLMSQAAYDCENRPDDDRTREVSFTLKLKPEMDADTRELRQVHVAVHGKCKVPPHVTSVYQMKADRTGLRFNRDFPDSPDQTPLRFEQGEVRDVD